MAQRGKQHEREVSTSQLKAHCSELVERVASQRESLVVTRRGRPVARLVPVDVEKPTLFGFARGAITIHGDIVEPLDVTWEAAE